MASEPSGPTVATDDVATGETADAGPAVPRRRRLTADARRHSILAAARAAFSETGDMNGTTIRAIAERGGISEGVIYKHFESKEQLFYEAVVEPLNESVDRLIAASEAVDRHEPLNPERQLETTEGLYRQLVSTLEEVLPLLGLVLFGDPATAARFYREGFAVAMDRLAAAWQAVDERYGLSIEAPDISARAVMGLALMLALEHHYAEGHDADRAVAMASSGTMHGFFPTIDPARRRP